MDSKLTNNNTKKVIEFNRRIEEYRFYQESIMVKKILMNGKEITEERILIMLEQSKNGIKKRVVHPVTEFIHRPLKRGGIPHIKTQNQVANYIVNFLNYILIEQHHIYKLNSISELCFEQGEGYLTAYGQTGRNKNNTPIQKSTVKRCESYLTQFYYFLAKKNVLKSITINDFDFTEYTYDDLSINRVPESPFNFVEYPNNNAEIEKKLIHDIPKELIIPFILTALSHTPRIALGVAFQCFGGVRVGEVVNITKTGLTPSGEFGKFGFQLKLQNRNFRPDLKSISGRGTPKKKRRQGIFPFNGELLQMLYKNHLKSYKATDGSNALFVNKNGKAMAKFSYQYYFDKLKDRFLLVLGESENPLLVNYGVELSSAKWSTHICRGIFSNLIAEDAQNVLQVMSARGDNNPLSSLTYLNGSPKMLNILKDNYNDMYVDLLQKREEIHRER
ncbi:hypothetical protein [Peribacillus simplex]|uniref:hypothetical protein n=1 Tax=Peribacillus simplex TaxID=1478 RepID=UPI003D2E1D6B